MTDSRPEQSDFWWLPPKADVASLLVGIGHHRPKTDDDQPPVPEWRCPIDNIEVLVGGQPCLHPLTDLEDARLACDNTNLYRTLELFSPTRVEFLGPFVLDIDNESLDNGRSQDLGEALRVTKQAMALLSDKYGLRGPDLRVFFTGCKGFNIEVRREALGIDGDVRQQVKESFRSWDRIVEDLRASGALPARGEDGATGADAIYSESGILKHPYLRVHGSFNTWVSSTGVVTSRLKMEVDADNLSNVSAQSLAQQAEGLANKGI